MYIVICQSSWQFRPPNPPTKSPLKNSPPSNSKVAVPCTVDNDLMMVDTSFGFDTACTEVCCHTAPRCVENHPFDVGDLHLDGAGSGLHQCSLCGSNLQCELYWHGTGGPGRKTHLEILVRLFFCSVVEKNMFISFGIIFFVRMRNGCFQK